MIFQLVQTVEFGPTIKELSCHIVTAAFKLRKRTKLSPLCSHVLKKKNPPPKKKQKTKQKKKGIWSFHVVVLQGRQRNVTKYITHVQSDCFAY